MSRAANREPENISLTVERLSHDGRGISHHNGKIVFVQGALAGEEILARVTKKHTRYIEARVESVIKSGEDRVNPDCHHHDLCGGCSLQHMSLAAQRSYKQTMMLEQLQHLGKVVPKNILPAIESGSVGYRRKARVGVRYVQKKEKLLIGFREKQSNFLADLSQCTVLHPAVGQNFETLRSLIQELSNYDAIPQIEVAVGDSEAALVFRHMREFSETDLQKLKAYAKLHTIQLYLQPGGVETVHKIWPETGEDRISYHLPDFNITLYCHPMDFMQINASVNAQLISKAIALLDISPNETVLDLFCGIGNFTLPLATRAQKVIAIEGAPEMVERLAENARANNINNIQGYCQNLHAEEFSFANLNCKIDKVLLDPPRTGALEVVKALIPHQPKRIVYISCHPATLARDANILCDNGYTLSAAGILDMFPHTTHIESMAIFDRKDA